MLQQQEYDLRDYTKTIEDEAITINVQSDDLGSKTSPRGDALVHNSNILVPKHRNARVSDD